MKSVSVGDGGYRAILSYSMLAFPLAFAGLPIYLHAPDFYASELGVPLATLGVALLGLRVIDAVQDPFIGYLSDRYHQWRIAIILAGALMLGAGFWMVFHPTQSLTLAWFCLAVFICTTGFSILSINFLTLGGLWRAEKDERTKVTGWREGVTLLGVLFAAVAPQFLGSLEDAAKAFHQLSIVYLPVLAVTLMIFLIWMRRAAMDEPQIDETQEALGSVGKDWRRLFFSIYFVNGLANAIPGIVFIFFVRDKLGAEELTGGFLLLYFLSGALAMPIWQFFAKRIGKLECWLVSMFLALATFFWASFLGEGDAVLFAVVCLLSGISLGGDLCLPPSLLADHISQTSTQTSASRYFAVMTFCSKSSLALATVAVFLVLGSLGYQPGAAAADNSTEYLGFVYATIPCVIKLICAVWLWQLIPRLDSMSSAEPIS